MSERVRKIVLVVVLIAAAIWGYQNIFGERTAQKPARPAAAAASVQPVPKAPTIERPVPEQVTALYAESWGTDPFRFEAPPAAAATGAEPPARPDWDLTGIFFSERGPIAVINDKLVRVGETIDQAKVVDINKKQVTLRIGGKERVLTIPNG